MDDTTILGSTLGQLGQTVKQAAKQVVKLPEEMGADLGGQMGGVPQRPGSEGQAKPGEPKQDWKSDEERVKFLKGFYGSSVDASADKPVVKPDEQKKLLELRQQLHKQVYYDPTFNPVKKQEERPAEKVENEKKQEMVDLQKKDAKKPPPLAVIREQNKAEQFRGASG